MPSAVLPYALCPSESPHPMQGYGLCIVLDDARGRQTARTWGQKSCRDQPPNTVKPAGVEDQVSQICSFPNPPKQKKSS